jgi:superfamily II DNA or RNA helicase
MTDVIIQKKNEVFIKLICEPHVLYELAPYFTFDVPGAKYSPAYKRGGWNGKMSLLSTSTGEIYCGLLDRVVAKLKAHGFSYEFKDNNHYGLPFEINTEITKEGVTGFMRVLGKKADLTPDDYQVNAVYECLYYNRKTIVSPTSSGKTFQIYSIIRYFLAKELKILIIFPTTSLIHQTYKEFQNYGLNSDDNCHMIYQGQYKKSDLPIHLSTFQSIYKMDKSFFNQYDVIIADECHRCTAKSLIDIMKKCPDAKYRFGFTGTLSNNDDSKAPNELTITGLFGPSYKTISTKELIERGRVSKLDIQCIVLKHPNQRFARYEDEVQYLIGNENRNNFICKLASKINNNTLMLFSRVETHGEILYNIMIKNPNKKVFFLHGGVEVEAREEVRQICETESNAVIIASYGIFSTGVNIKNLHNIIFASSSKGKIRILQSIGRGLRKNNNKEKAVLYDIADDCGNNYTLKHFMERVKIYNEEEFDYDIKTVFLNDE